MRVQSCSLPVADLCEIHSHPCPGALRQAFAQVLKPLVMSIQYMVPSYPVRTSAAREVSGIFTAAPNAIVLRPARFANKGLPLDVRQYLVGAARQEVLAFYGPGTCSKAIFGALVISQEPPMSVHGRYGFQDATTASNARCVEGPGVHWCKRQL